MRSRDRHTIIVGGGVIGVCCAYFLAKRGARVTVLERDQIGKGASYGNAGSITPGHPPINKLNASASYNQPTTLRNLRLDRTPPVYDIRHALKANWIYEFP